MARFCVRDSESAEIQRDSGTFPCDSSTFPCDSIGFRRIPSWIPSDSARFHLHSIFILSLSGLANSCDGGGGGEDSVTATTFLTF